MNEQDWNEFRKKYPNAAAFIDRRELQREKERLTAELVRLEGMDFRLLACGDNLKRSVWVRDRLEELKGLALPPVS